MYDVIDGHDGDFTDGNGNVFHGYCNDAMMRVMIYFLYFERFSYVPFPLLPNFSMYKEFES